MKIFLINHNNSKRMAIRMLMINKMMQNSLINLLSRSKFENMINKKIFNKYNN